MTYASKESHQYPLTAIFRAQTRCIEIFNEYQIKKNAMIVEAIHLRELW